MESQYYEFMNNTAKMLVEHPEDVRIEKTRDDRGVLLTVYVNPADAGLILGRQGQMANALRTIAKAIGSKERANVAVRIEVPHNQPSAPRGYQPSHVHLDDTI